MKKFALIILGLSLFITGCGEEKSKKEFNNSVVVSQGSKPKSLDPNMSMVFISTSSFRLGNYT